jgi:hypothetical protein
MQFSELKKLQRRFCLKVERGEYFLVGRRCDNNPGINRGASLGFIGCLFVAESMNQKARMYEPNVAPPSTSKR